MKKDEKPERTQEPQQEVKLTRATASELPAEQLKLKESYITALEDIETEFLKPSFDKIKSFLQEHKLPVNSKTIEQYLGKNLEKVENVVEQRLQTFCEIKEKQGVKLDYFPLIPEAMETLMGWVKDEEIATQQAEIQTLRQKIQTLQEKALAHQSENEKLKAEIDGFKERLQEQQKVEENLQEELNAARAELAALKQKATAPVLAELSEEQRKAIQEKAEQKIKFLLASNEVLQKAYLIKNKLENILSLLKDERVQIAIKEGGNFKQSLDTLDFVSSSVRSMEEKARKQVTLLTEAEEKNMSEQNRQYLAKLIEQEREFSGTKKHEEDTLKGLENNGATSFVFVLDTILTNLQKSRPEIFEHLQKENMESLIQDLLKASELEDIGAKPGDKYDTTIHEPVIWEQGTGKPQDEIIKISKRGFIKNEKVLRRALVIVAQ